MADFNQLGKLTQGGLGLVKRRKYPPGVRLGGGQRARIVDRLGAKSDGSDR